MLDLLGGQEFSVLEDEVFDFSAHTCKTQVFSVRSMPHTRSTDTQDQQFPSACEGKIRHGISLRPVCPHSKPHTPQHQRNTRLTKKAVGS